MREGEIELHTLAAATNRQRPRSPNGVLENCEHSHDKDPGLQLHALNSRGSYPEWSGSENTATWAGHLRRGFTKIWNGPTNPRDFTPRPIQWLLFLEELPGKLKQRFSSGTKACLLGVYLVLWLLFWTYTLVPYLGALPSDVEGMQVISLTCGGAESFWKGKNAACGLNAHNCISNDDVIIRCPALCDRGSWLYSLRAVGAEVIKYRGYFIGGGDSGPQSRDTLSYPYRADSFPCGAAMHAGILSPIFGGCARVSYASGAQNRFPGVRGHYGVADSIEFPSFFPFSYVFKRLPVPLAHCHDPRLLVMLINILLGVPVVYLTSGIAFYWILATVGFWTIITATDPPVLVDPADSETLARLISVGLERFLPTCFILYALWHLSVKHTFGIPVSESGDIVNKQPGSPCSRVLLWYPFFWLSVLNNLTFDRLPVDRLTWHDIHEQPGALVTISIVFLFLVTCIVAQAYYVWLLGRFWKLLLVYGGIFAGMCFLANLPGLTLRIHHYIFGLIFIPGCATRGRTAYAFQGILLGFFLSGVARWGYASIAETSISLLRGEPLGQLAYPQITGFSQGLLYWNSTHSDTSLSTRVSLLVNDIERYRGESNGTVDISEIFQGNDELKALVGLELSDSDTPVYLRLAIYLVSKRAFGDYTRAAILKIPSFEFEVPPPGIT